MNTMFGIPKSKIVQVKNPYKPNEILSKFDEETTAFVTVVGEKDKNRLRMGPGRYFELYKGEHIKTNERWWICVCIKNDRSSRKRYQVQWYVKVCLILMRTRKKFFNKIYPKFNDKIFDLISSKLIRSEK